MSAEPEPQDRPDILPIPREPSPPQRNPVGYVEVPKSSTFSPNLKPSDKVVLEGLIAFCYRRNTWTRATTREIAKAVCLHPQTVKIAMRRLTKFGFIVREPNPDAVGGRWITHIPCHWRAAGNSVQPTVHDNLNKHTPGGVKNTPPGESKLPPRGSQNYPPISNPNYKPNNDDDVPPSESVVVVSSAPPLNPDPQPEPPSPVVAELVDLVRARWPDEPNVEPRVAELAKRGQAEAVLAVEYAVLMAAKGYVYAVKTRDRWQEAGYSSAQCEADVAPKRPRPEPPQAAMQNHNPPAAIEAETPPAAEDVAATLATIRAGGPRVMVKLNLVALRRWAEAGWVAPEVLDEFACILPHKTGDAQCRPT